MIKLLFGTSKILWLDHLTRNGNTTANFKYMSNLCQRPKEARRISIEYFFLLYGSLDD